MWNPNSIPDSANPWRGNCSITKTLRCCRDALLPGFAGIDTVGVMFLLRRNSADGQPSGATHAGMPPPLPKLPPSFDDP